MGVVKPLPGHSTVLCLPLWPCPWAWSVAVVLNRPISALLLRPAGRSPAPQTRRWRVPVEELIRVNNLGDPDRLLVDQRIFVPGVRAPSWSWPVAGGQILSYFGERRSGHRHSGLDIRGRRDQEVLAVRSGRVLYSSPPCVTTEGPSSWITATACARCTPITRNCCL